MEPHSKGTPRGRGSLAGWETARELAAAVQLYATAGPQAYGSSPA